MSGISNNEKRKPSKDNKEKESLSVTPFLDKAKEELYGQKAIISEPFDNTLYYRNPEYWSTLARRANIHLTEFEEDSGSAGTLSLVTNDNHADGNIIKSSGNNDSKNRNVVINGSGVSSSDFQWYEKLKERYNNYVSSSKKEEKEFYENLDKEYRVEREKMLVIKEDETKMKKLSQFIKQLRLGKVLSEGANRHKSESVKEEDIPQTDAESLAQGIDEGEISKAVGEEKKDQQYSEIVNIHSSSEEENMSDINQTDDEQDDGTYSNDKEDNVADATSVNTPSEEESDELNNSGNCSEGGNRNYAYSEQEDNSENKTESGEPSREDSEEEDFEYLQNEESWPPRISVVPHEEVDEQHESRGSSNCPVSGTSEESRISDIDVSISESEADIGNSSDQANNDEGSSEESTRNSVVDSGIATERAYEIQLEEHSNESDGSLGESTSYGSEVADVNGNTMDNAIAIDSEDESDSVEQEENENFNENPKTNIQPEINSTFTDNNYADIIENANSTGDASTESYWMHIARLTQESENVPEIDDVHRRYAPEESENYDDDVINSDESEADKTGYIHVAPSDSESESEKDTTQRNLLNENQKVDANATFESSSLDPQLFETAVEDINTHLIDNSTTEQNANLGDEFESGQKHPDFEKLIIPENTKDKVSRTLDNQTAIESQKTASGASVKSVAIGDNDKPSTPEYVPPPLKIPTPQPAKLNPSLLDLLDQSITIHNKNSAGSVTENDEDVIVDEGTGKESSTRDTNVTLLPRKIWEDKAISPNNADSHMEENDTVEQTSEILYKDEVAKAPVSNDRKDLVGREKHGKESDALGNPNNLENHENTSEGSIGALSESSMIMSRTEEEDDTAYVTALYNETLATDSPEVIPANRTVYISNDSSDNGENDTSDASANESLIREEESEKSSVVKELQSTSLSNEESENGQEIVPDVEKDADEANVDQIGNTSGRLEEKVESNELHTSEAKKRSLENENDEEEEDSSLGIKIRRILSFGWLKSGSKLKKLKTVDQIVDGDSALYDKFSEQSKKTLAAQLDNRDSGSDGQKSISNSTEKPTAMKLIHAAESFANDAIMSSSSLDLLAGNDDANSVHKSAGTESVKSGEGSISEASADINIANAGKISGTIKDESIKGDLGDEAASSELNDINDNHSSDESNTKLGSQPALNSQKMEMNSVVAADTSFTDEDKNVKGESIDVLSDNTDDAAVDGDINKAGREEAENSFRKETKIQESLKSAASQIQSAWKGIKNFVSTSDELTGGDEIQINREEDIETHREEPEPEEAEIVEKESKKTVEKENVQDIMETNDISNETAVAWANNDGHNDEDNEKETLNNGDDDSKVTHDSSTLDNPLNEDDDTVIKNNIETHVSTENQGKLSNKVSGVESFKGESDETGKVKLTDTQEENNGEEDVPTLEVRSHELERADEKYGKEIVISNGSETKNETTVNKDHVTNFEKMKQGGLLSKIRTILSKGPSNNGGAVETSSNPQDSSDFLKLKVDEDLDDNEILAKSAPDLLDSKEQPLNDIETIVVQPESTKTDQTDKISGKDAVETIEVKPENKIPTPSIIDEEVPQTIVVHPEKTLETNLKEEFQSDSSRIQIVPSLPPASNSDIEENQEIRVRKRGRSVGRDSSVENSENKQRRLSDGRTDSVSRRTRSRSKSPRRRDLAYRGPSIRRASGGSGISTRSGRVLSYDSAQIETNDPSEGATLTPKQEAELPRGIRDLVEEAEYFIEEDSGKEDAKTSKSIPELSKDAIDTAKTSDSENLKPHLDFKGSYLVKQKEDDEERITTDDDHNKSKTDAEENIDTSIAARLKSNRLLRGRASKAAMATRANHLKQSSSITSENVGDTERRHRISFKNVVRKRRTRIRKRRTRAKGRNVRRRKL